MTAIEREVEIQDVQSELAIPAEAHGLAIEYIDRTLIEPDPEQPRVEADAELRASIAAEGIRQPIQVRPHPERLGDYMIIDGERRWRGAEGVMDRLPCIVRRDHEQDARRLIGQLTSNKGKPLTAVEESRAYHRLLAQGLTQADVARALGVPRTTVGDRVRLMELGPWVPLIESGEIPIAHAIEYLVPIRGVPDKFHLQLIDKLRKDFRYQRNEGEASSGISSYDFGNVLDQISRNLFYPLAKSKTTYAKQPEFDTRNHDAECSCGGITRAEFQGDSGTRRWCGNPDWWKPLHRKAAAEKKPKSRGKKKANVPSWQRLPAEASSRQEKYYYSQRKGEHQIVRDGHWNIDHLRFDPDAFLAQVDPAKLILVTCGHEKPSIATTDAAAVKAAQASYAERQASRRAAYVEKRREALGEITSADHAVRGDGVAALLAVFVEEAHGGIERIYDAAELLGIDPQPPNAESSWSARPKVAKWAGALEPKQAARVATAVVTMASQKWPSIDKALEKSTQSENANLLRVPMRWPGTPAERGSSPAKAAKSEPASAAELACIECGCTEDNACEGGCAWLAVDKKRNVGVCSSCANEKAEAKAMLKEHASAEAENDA